MKRLISSLALLLTLPLAGCSVSVGGLSLDGCAYSAPHSAEVPVEGAKSIRVDGWAGGLTMIGSEGASAVTVKGTACTSREGVLGQIGLKTERIGDAIVVTVTHPEFVTGSAYMDLTINLPAALTAEVDKASGDTRIENLAGLTIEKSSGELEVRQIKGDLAVETSSGDVLLKDVTGATTYEGSSGDLTMQGMQGAVTIVNKSSGQVVASDLSSEIRLENVSSGDLKLQDVKGSVKIGRKSSGSVTVSGVGGSFIAETIGSGTMEVKDVTGDVTIQSKSSGSLTITGVGKSVLLDDMASGTLKVADVKGDLTVHSKSSGSVSYDRIGGKVDVPKQ